MKQAFLYGTVLKVTREDTLADLERHFQMMVDAGLDTVVIWPSAFWWEEKKEGYPFNTGRRILELAERIGIKVIMELAGQLPMMEYIPDFQMKEEYYCTDEHGHKKIKHTSFGCLNYFHPEVDALISAHFAKTARAYKDYPSLIAYDVFNETAFNSYDAFTVERFRRWLRKKYQTIEKLNAVWEHNYTDFSQIGFAPWMWMSIMPAADWHRFRRESVGMFVRGWCDAIRAVDPSRPLIADNIGSMLINKGSYERPQDDFSLAEAVDEIGMSFYPKQVTGTQNSAIRWQVFDSFYAASKRKGFYVSEMQTHIQALFNPPTCVRPYELKRWCMEAVAAGAKGLIYWMWRPFTKGLQTAGRGLIDYKERSTPRLEFVKEFSSVVGELGVLTPLQSKVGILFDPLCLDFQKLYTRCYKVDQDIYLESVSGAYGALLKAGARADIVTVDEIGSYKVLILSNHIVISKETAAALRAFAEAGGILLCDGKIGYVDEESMLAAALPGGPFNDCMGLEFLDTDYEAMEFFVDGERCQGFFGKEITALTDGKAAATFADGTPAIVEKQVGKGTVITVNTHLWYSFGKGDDTAERLAARWVEAFDLAGIRVSSPLAVRVAENEKTRFAFVFNDTDQDVSGYISGSGFEGKVSVAAQDVQILKVKKP
ncbi:MAG: beta-galactosidase [Clostridia bacterium]|nr:beta-galactosidase [Clostridia bacterium]